LPSGLKTLKTLKNVTIIKSKTFLHLRFPLFPQMKIVKKTFTNTWHVLITLKSSLDIKKTFKNVFLSKINTFQTFLKQLRKMAGK